MKMHIIMHEGIESLVLIKTGFNFQLITAVEKRLLENEMVAVFR